MISSMNELFAIRFKIVDDVEEMRTMSLNELKKEHQQIAGFIEVSFGKHKVGYYLETPEVFAITMGEEWIDWWMDLLLKSLIELFSKGYSAFLVPEMNSKWVVFEKEGDNVTINLAFINDHHSTTKFFISEKSVEFDYVLPVNYTILGKELAQIILDSATSFLLDVGAINSNLLKTNMYTDIQAKITEASNLWKND